MYEYQQPWYGYCGHRARYDIINGSDAYLITYTKDIEDISKHYHTPVRSTAMTPDQSFSFFRAKQYPGQRRRAKGRMDLAVA
jgi:hypothetical protein